MPSDVKLFTKTSDTPCHNCNERYVDCHSTCNRYINWKKEYDLLNEKVRENKEKYSLMFSFCSYGREANKLVKKV